MNPVPSFTPEKWKTQGLCNSYNPELWYPDPIMGPTPSPVKIVKSICARCPVRNECLTAALDAKEKHGIWGGMTVKERNRLAKETR